MDIKIYEKPVMTKFVTIDNVEFELNDLICALQEISQTKEFDHYGEYSLRDYELECSYDTITKLVEMGYVSHYIGSRQAQLYKAASNEKIQDLLEQLCKL